MQRLALACFTLLALLAARPGLAQTAYGQYGTPPGALAEQCKKAVRAFNAKVAKEFEFKRFATQVKGLPPLQARLAKSCRAWVECQAKCHSAFAQGRRCRGMKGASKKRCKKRQKACRTSQCKAAGRELACQKSRRAFWTLINDTAHPLSKGRTGGQPVSNQAKNLAGDVLTACGRVYPRLGPPGPSKGKRKRGVRR